MRDENANPNSRRASWPARTTCAGRGFTLIELLVVIAIIGLLATLFLPALGVIKDRAKAAKARVRIMELLQGCSMYKRDTGYYPGQLYPDELTGSNGSYTGSQVLAACMFNYRYADINKADPGATEGHASLNPSDLIFLKRQNTLSDRFGSSVASGAMPLLYYPSRLGVSGLDQYKEGDNSLYTAGTWTGTAFRQYIKSTKILGAGSTTPHNDGEFLLIAAGSDREYGTAYDVTNW